VAGVGEPIADQRAKTAGSIGMESLLIVKLNSVAELPVTLSGLSLKNITQSFFERGPNPGRPPVMGWISDLGSRWLQRALL
jgi:hypothetical protein